MTAAPLSKFQAVSLALRGEIPHLQAIAEQAFALAQETPEHGRRRDMDRVGIRAADLITALCALKD